MRISDWSADVCSSDLVTQLGRGAVFNGVQNISLTGDNVYGIRSDGFNFVQVQDVKVIGNSLKDFSPAAGDHADAIQFWTTGSTVETKNIEIYNNTITRQSDGQITWTRKDDE